MSTLIDDAKTYLHFRDVAESAEAAAKDARRDRDEAARIMIDSMLNEGVPSITVDGRKVGTSTAPRASLADKATGFEWLRGHGYGDVISETVHPQTLTRIVKELREQGHEIPPAIQVYDQVTPSVRKA